MIEHLNAFLGIALSVLVLFVVFDEKELYKKVTKEIRDRINKSLSRLEEKDHFSKRMDKLKNRLNEIRIKNAEAYENHQFVTKIDEKALDKTDALDSQIKKCQTKYARIQLLSPQDDKSHISIQAALYTALFIVSVSGLDTLYKLYKGLDMQDFLHTTLSSLTYFSIFYWACAWAFRAAYNEYIVRNPEPNNISLEAKPQKGIPWRKALKHYRERMKIHTTPSSMFILLIIILLWAGLIWLCSMSAPGWFLAIATFYVLIAGGMGFLARENPREGVPYLNMYGQIAMILIFSMMLGCGDIIFNTRYIPDFFIKSINWNFTFSTLLS